MGKLTALAVERAAKAGLYSDGDGLYLQLKGGKSWLFKFSLDGKPHEMGLGSTKAISLKEARALAAEARTLCAKKINPIEQRRSGRLAERIANAKTTTFAQCGEQYLIAHEAGWRSAKHRQQWRTTLATYVYPVIGALPVQAINTDLVMRVLQPIWNEMPETASRVRQRIEAILDWATARELRQGENAARWRGHIKHLLPAKSKIAKTESHAALPYDAIGDFVVDLRKHQGIGARCLEFTILTAARTGEALGARWEEFDLDAGIRTIPAARMKGGLEHRVPLAPPVVRLLRELAKHRTSEWVFNGRGIGEPLSSQSMLKVLALMNRSDLTVHGFRSTFTDWGHERTNFPGIVIDMALAHKVGDKVQAAYRRGDLFDKRRKLMEAWARFCAMPASETKRVVPLHAAQ